MYTLGRMLWKLLILLIFLESAACLMCYQCADTSDKEDCQTYVRTMRKRQKTFRDTGHIGTYIKNCSGFGDLKENDTYCYVGLVKTAGTGAVRSFIRDCSDGKHFFEAKFNERFTKENVINDNQTACVYYGQGYVACVTYCGPNRDFCNGPVATATSNIVSITLLLFSLVYTMS